MKWLPQLWSREDQNNIIVPEPQRCL